MTTQTTYKFGNLNITQTVEVSPRGIYKHNDVSREANGICEILGPSDPDFKKAIILMHNYKNQ